MDLTNFEPHNTAGATPEARQPCTRGEIASIFGPQKSVLKEADFLLHGVTVFIVASAYAETVKPHCEKQKKSASYRILSRGLNIDGLPVPIRQPGLDEHARVDLCDLGRHAPA